MEQKRSSLLSSLFPWRSPFVLKFVVAKGGIEIQLFRNGRRITRWRAAKLRRVLPESLVKWIDENQIAIGPRPHPLTRQLWQYLSPLASQKLIIDTSELAALQEVSQPARFALIWEIDQVNARIQGKYQGADNYLGLNWFQTGNMIWPLLKPLHPTIAAQFEQLVAQDLVIPLPEAEALLNGTIPALQQSFFTRADFQFISDFALNVTVQNAQSGKLILTLESNYPQLLPTLSIPQQETDFFLAQQALIQFPRQALTPVLMHLLQDKGAPVSLQGEDIPLFISEQLPVMRHYNQISDDMVRKIRQAYPIVPIATLPANFASPVRIVEQGIGKYGIAATYQYHDHILDMHALLDAYRRKQRFINQYGIWFEWSADAHLQAQRIRQSLVPRILQPAEVMGLDTRQSGQWQYKPPAYAIQPEGTTPFERVQSLFRQLQYHGVPGGIFGNPAGLVNMVLSACDNLVRDNRQARILWLTTSHKKGAVTRAVNASTIQRNVTVASSVTLRDNASLVSQSWTLVIFHGLDQLRLEKSPEVWKFTQLKWQLAFLTMNSQLQFDAFMMRILHLPERYDLQFRERYLFDPTRSYKKMVLPGPSFISTAPPITHSSEREPKPATTPATPVVSLFSTHEITMKSKTSPLPLQPKKAEASRPAPATPAPSPSSPRENKIADKISPLSPVDQVEQKAVYETKSASAPVANRPSPVNNPVQATPDNVRSRSMSSTGRPAIELNPAKIAQLHEESEHLQERLTVEETAPSLPAIAVPPVSLQPVLAVKQEPAQPAAAQQFEKTEAVRKVQAGPSSLPPSLRSETKGKKKSAQKTEQKHSTQPVAASSMIQRPARLASSQAPLPIQPEAKPMSSPGEIIASPHKPAQLNQEAISKLREESEHLQERLTIEEEGVQELAGHPVTGEAQEVADVTPGPIEPASVISTANQVAPEVDEDWQMIYPQWSFEHWEILRLLCQGQTIQLTVGERSKRRPISLLLDEINSPVDEHLNDLLIDAETQTLAPHLRSTVEQLVRWYFSLESR